MSTQNDTNSINTDVEIKRINGYYDSLESKVRFERLTGKEHWVTPQKTKIQPIHQWYTLKESFSPDLVKWALDRHIRGRKKKQLRLLDPFAGAGTVGVMGSALGHNVDLVEYNPFIRLVARAKATPSKIDVDILKSALELPDWSGVRRESMPKLSTLREKKYYKRQDVQRLVGLRGWLEDNLGIGPSIERDALWTGLAWTAQEVGNLRKDGRALRYQKKEERSVDDLVLLKWKQIVDDVEQYQNPKEGTCRVLAGSAVDFRHLKDEAGNTEVSLEDETYDFIFYSPPYLNNFDYFEIYKVELWVLGLLTSSDQWKAGRRGSLRSHPSIRHAAASFLPTIPALDELYTFLFSLENSSLLKGRAQREMGVVFTGYFEDMYRSLLEQFRVLRSGGILSYNVANSRHNLLPIATDVLILEVARSVGFVPLEVVELRHRNGRTKNKEHLRESVVFLRKP
jgi:DNA modification methylase